MVHLRFSQQLCELSFLHSEGLLAQYLGNPAARVAEEDGSSHAAQGRQKWGLRRRILRVGMFDAIVTFAFFSW